MGTDAKADASDAEYTDLVRKLESLTGKTDTASVAERGRVQKRIADILTSRRKTDRFQCFVTVSLTAGAQTANATLTNIGAGGGYLKTALSLEKMSLVKFEVKQAGRLPTGLVFPVQVRWVKPGHGVGVAFQELGAKEQEAVKKVLGELVREQPPQQRGS